MLTCKICNGTGWVDLRVIPVGGEDFGPVDQDVVNCPLCDLGLTGQDYFDLPQHISDNIPYWVADPVGGYEGTLGLWQHYVNSQLVRSVYVTRAVANFWSPDVPLESCPVCSGWGITSMQGEIHNCIACGGQPAELRRGYDPLYSWWLRKVGPGALWMQRRPENPPLSGDEILAHLELMPGMVRVN